MGPYNWMGFPPSVQRYLGMLWMAKLLYPDAADYDLQAEVTEYFDLFYHCALTGEQYEAPDGQLDREAIKSHIPAPFGDRDACIGRWITRTIGKKEGSA